MGIEEGNERVDEFARVSLKLASMGTVGGSDVVTISGLYDGSVGLSKNGELEGGHANGCVSKLGVSISFRRVAKLSGSRGPICMGGVCGNGFGSYDGRYVGGARDGGGAGT